MDIKYTDDIVNTNVNLVIYGNAGVGKTYLISTAPKPIVLSSEAGLLSIKNFKIPYIEINSIEALRDAYKWFYANKDKKEYETIVIDSLSEIADVVLSEQKRAVKDARKAYMETQETIATAVRLFRDLPYHIYVTAKIEKSQNADGEILFYPYLPGNKSMQNLPYFFDEVFALCVSDKVDDSGNRKRVRYLITSDNGVYSAKDRSGELSKFEENPNLTDLINKMLNRKAEKSK